MSIFSTRTKTSKTLATLSVAALLTAPLGAHAAECFDRDTDDPKAGNATAVIGPAVDVSRLNIADMFRPDNGADMFTGDTVRTGADSHLQLKLCDWSTYTFSPNSESEISEFFDSAGAGRRRVVNFARGGFRFASGRDTEPGSTDVELQDTGVTMGVRGTNVILVELDGFIYALLEGPIRDNSGLTPKGLVEFWTDGNRNAIVARLKRPGFVVRIGPDGVSRPYRAGAALLRRIYDAFVPVVPEDGGSALDYAGDPLGDSGQGAQEGDDDRQYADNKGRRDNEDTEDRPEQPSQGEDEVPPPVIVQVGEILPLDELEDFAAMQVGPDGHVLALASAQLFTDNGTGPVLQDDGVALIQITVDWATRTIAPEALASFVRFDFSVSDPADLSIDDSDFFIPEDIEDAFVTALLASSDIPFALGAGDLAVFSGQVFDFTIRQGVGDTVTVDVDSDFSAADQQGTTYNVVTSVTDLMVMPGAGELAYFDFPLSEVLTTTEIDGFFTSGQVLLSGLSDTIVSTLGTPTILNGLSIGQLVVDFDARTVGGGSSFLAITAAADGAIGGAKATQLVFLDQPVPFASGLFDLAFYPLAGLSSGGNVLNGQALVGSSGELTGDIAAILSDGAGNHLYTEVSLADTGLLNAALADIAGLDAQNGVIEGLFSVPVGTTFRYNGTAGRSSAGFAEIERSNGTFFGAAEASIDISFANRTLGGGNSFVSVDIQEPTFGVDVQFTELLNQVSFDDGVNGAGVFGFDGSDFSGSNIDSALFLIRENTGGGTGVGAGETADLYFNFNDGAGGAGFGAVEQIPVVDGATP